jgi:hypothetical protein
MHSRMKREMEVLADENAVLTKNSAPNELDKELLEQMNKMMMSFKE